MGSLAPDNISDRIGFYERRRRILTSDMEYDNPDCTVVILSRLGLLTPDLIETVLNESHPDVQIRQHWTGRLGERKNWCSGATAIFRDPPKASRATKHLQMASSCWVAVPFSEFFRVLVEAEIRHPEFEGGFTRVVVEAKEPLQTEQKLRFENSLMDFGPCEKIRFHVPSGDYGAICTAIYQFAAHAIAAQSVLNGQVIEGTGRISVVLQTTSKVKDILGFAKDYFT